MSKAKKIFDDFKNFDKPLVISDSTRNYNRYNYKNDFELSIDYFKKSDLGAELLAIKMIDKNLQNLVNAKDKLEKFSNELCDRITYLTESFRLIEMDSKNNKAQIRSYPPFIKQNEKLFFEIVINASQCSLLLSRKVYDKYNHSTKPVSFILNDEILERIIADLILQNA
ncbi:MAG: hypothetical protein D8M58_09890 [Calditrichaeota bacterium]|nr:MAG: hypothetical protein DWQ03_09265 [Calditrichota bacterium]MBL1205699.1 hypothetical protein [Calditrichota bacterium]NOG45527.1 hypothetical protein [Calditrichota bacterium]